MFRNSRDKMRTRKETTVGDLFSCLFYGSVSGSIVKSLSPAEIVKMSFSDRRITSTAGCV